MTFSPSRENLILGTTQTLFCSAACVVLFFGQAVCAQSQNTQGNETTESSKSTTEVKVDNVSPSRTTESHATIGNRQLDSQRVERIGPDGAYQPYSETETETIQVNPATTRVVVRTYFWDFERRRDLARFTEEESHRSANGDSHLVRVTSDMDANGNLKVAVREVADTKNTSPTTQEVQTTTYTADGTGDFRPNLRTHELQTRETDQTTEVKKTTLQPDGNGNWTIIEEGVTQQRRPRCSLVCEMFIQTSGLGQVPVSSDTFPSIGKANSNSAPLFRAC